MAQPPARRFHEVVALYSSGRLADAEDAATALTQAHPTDAASRNLLGVIHAHQGKPTAVEHFRQAAALNPTWDEPHANLGLFHTQQRDFAAASDALRAALELKPGNAATAINLGNALRELGALDDAVAVFRGALGSGPHQAVAYSNLGTTQFDRGDFADAVLCFRRAAAIQPDFATAHLNLGRGLFRLGQLDEAAAALRRAAALSPRDAEIALMLANVLRDLGGAEEALEYYQRTLDLQPGNREAGASMGALLLARGRPAEGLAAIARGPGIVTLSLAPQPAPVRVVIPGGPHFIGAWQMDPPQVCDDLIALFESRAKDHAQGRSALGVNIEIKNSTDLTIQPADLNTPGFEPVKAYLRHLESCVADYARQWPVFGSMFGQVDVVPFNIQRYQPGGHFQRVHAERMSFSFIHRVMAWMTYLNDVEANGDGGGETVFDHYGLAVKPERGKTLIWPAEWTHAHHGGVVRSGRKYIITGWMHFPPPK